MRNANLQQLRIAAVLGALAVGLGAFGAHGLKAALESRSMLATWQTAAHYHLVHSVLLVVLALAGHSRWGWRCIAAGVVLFAGSLYGLALNTSPALAKVLGPVTPLGGMFLIIGWVLLAFERPRS